MATSSILGGRRLPEQISGKSTGALGPSDNSDSGSDSQGAYGGDELYSDSDAEGTGERTSAGSGLDQSSADILPDHIEGSEDESASDSTESEERDDTREVESLAADDTDDLDDADDESGR